MEWKKLELLVTNNCNFDCKYCYVKKNSKDMTFKIAKTAIDYHFKDIDPQKYGYVITFLGGEPLLKYRLIKKIIRYCEEIAQKHKIRIWYQLTTNGSLLTEEQCKYFKTLPFQLTLSVDGDKEMHDISRISKSGHSTYDIVKNKFKLFQKYFPERSPNMVVSPYNVHRLNEGIQYLHEQGFEHINANYSMTGGDFWDKEKLKICDEELKKVCKFIKEKTTEGKKIQISRIHKIVFNHALNKKNAKYLCHATRKGMTVGANGKIYLCHRFLNMDESCQYKNKQNDFIFGEVTDEVNVNEDKEKMHLLLKKQTTENLYSECKECKYYELCEPPCFWINYMNNNGDFLKLDNQYCKHYKLIIKNSLKLYEDLKKENLLDQYLANFGVVLPKKAKPTISKKTSQAHKQFAEALAKAKNKKIKG